MVAFSENLWGCSTALATKTTGYFKLKKKFQVAGNCCSFRRFCSDDLTLLLLLVLLGLLTFLVLLASLFLPTSNSPDSSGFSDSSGSFDIPLTLFTQFEKRVSLLSERLSARVHTCFRRVRYNALHRPSVFSRELIRESSSSHLTIVLPFSYWPPPNPAVTFNLPDREIVPVPKLHLLIFDAQAP